MKENQPYDEQRYAGALENMVRQCIDYEDTHEILTEWNKSWEIFQKIVKTAEYKIGISGLMESQDYQYMYGCRIWKWNWEMQVNTKSV